MSLTHPRRTIDRKVATLLNTISPKKKDFYSGTGCVPFDSLNLCVVPSQLSNPMNARLSGIAFDYYARFLVAQKVKGYSDVAVKDLVAGRIFLFSSTKWRGYQKEKECGYNSYRKVICKILELINSGDLLEGDEAAQLCILLAKMEREYRGGSKAAPEFEINKDDDEIIWDVRQLAEVFADKFLPVVKNESVVVFNPTFGIGSQIVGGADADIYIDGTLYDFKVKKDNRWLNSEARQLMGYYILDAIAKDAEDESNNLYNFPIYRLALYSARFAEIDAFDITQCRAERNELVKQEIRFEYLMQGMCFLNDEEIGLLGIPLRKEELWLCTDNAEAEIAMWKEIENGMDFATPIIEAREKLEEYLRRTDTKELLRRIVNM